MVWITKCLTICQDIVIMLLYFISSSIQVYWSSSLSWYSTSLCWPCCPVTTPYLYTMSCLGLWPAWAQLEQFLFLEVCSSSSSPFLSAPGRNACHKRIVPHECSNMHTVFLMSSLGASGVNLWVWIFLALKLNFSQKLYKVLNWCQHKKCERPFFWMEEATGLLLTVSFLVLSCHK